MSFLSVCFYQTERQGLSLARSKIIIDFKPPSSDIHIRDHYDREKPLESKTGHINLRPEGHKDAAMAPDMLIYGVIMDFYHTCILFGI